MSQAKNRIYTVLRKGYVFSRVFREMILLTVFGYVSKCKHSPSCGEYCMQVLRTEGILPTLRKGLPRIISCY